jgi:uncharacterized protein
VSDLSRRIGTALFTAPVLIYRRFVSPLFPPVCRFEPTCSEYALDALRIHGPLKGTVLTAKRLSRCHPFTWLGAGQGFDPVPPE